MLTWPAGVKVFVCTRVTDMRCGFDTLAAQVTRFLEQDPMSGHLFVYRSRKGDRVKVLYWDADGYALWSKRLERGTVKLATVDPESTPGLYRVEMTAGDLGLILRGIDPAEVRRRSRYRKPTPARLATLALPAGAGGVEPVMEDSPSPPLATDVATLQGMVRELLATVADLRKTVESQQHRIGDLTRRLYGKKSERVVGDNSAPGEVRPAATSADPPPRRRCGHGRRPLPEHLPRERVEFDLSEAEKACPCCGKPRFRIGAETSEQLDYRPASLFVVQRVRHTYACPGCSRTADPADGPAPTITTAPLRAQPIDKGLPGPGLLAHVVVSKFADHLPLYRQEGMLARHGVDVSRSTLGGWIAAAADLLKPLVRRMAELVRQSRVIQTDDTPVPVLDPGSRRTKTGHLWVYLGDADHPYAVFDFTPTYSGDGPRAWLGGYAGYVQADALRQYDPLFDRPPPRPTEVGCFAHARRKFCDARATDPARAHEALARIRRLYDIEAEVKPHDDADRLAARRSRARPVLDALFAWLEEQRGQVLPKSPIGVAIGYALGNRAALTRYCEARFLQIDNNTNERALRAVAVGRKNYLFAGSDAGGRSAAVLYSAVGTCRRLGLDPFAYLRDALVRLPSLPPGRLDDLLPDRWVAGRAGTVP